MEILPPSEIKREAEKLLMEIKQMQESATFRIAQNKSDGEAKITLKECDNQIEQLERIISRARKLEANEKRSQGFLSGRATDSIFRQLGGS